MGMTNTVGYGVKREEEAKRRRQRNDDKRKTNITKCSLILFRLKYEWSKVAIRAKSLFQ